MCVPISFSVRHQELLAWLDLPDGKHLDPPPVRTGNLIGVIRGCEYAVRSPSRVWAVVDEPAFPGTGAGSVQVQVRAYFKDVLAIAEQGLGSVQHISAVPCNYFARVYVFLAVQA